MKILIEPGPSRQALTTIAIGKPYYDAWYRNAYPLWEKYCRRHGLGLIVFDEDLISRDHPLWKKATWQKMLIADTLIRENVPVDRVCYADTDILINYHSPNIFDEAPPDRIGLTSLRHNLPFPLKFVQRRMAFLRHTKYSDTYPLDSALFMSLEQLYEHHDLPVQPDEACMGLIVFNVRRHAEKMKAWFEKYDRNVQSVTGGGDQTHINYEIQSDGDVAWLDYRFQAIWVYEMAWKYPFLYENDVASESMIRKAIEASLYSNYFLHFAGSWHESEMWTVGGFFENEEDARQIEEFYTYLETPVAGDAIGMVKPGKGS